MGAHEPTAFPARTHLHIFDQGNQSAQRSTRLVALITTLTMAVEIIGGWQLNSMALLADGWHMGTHAVAIGLSAFAYGAARHYANDPRFAFGTWKIEALGSFASAILLLGVGAIMIWESIERLITPKTINYPDAIIITALGLLVNVVCTIILRHPHNHEHEHGNHDHPHDHGDLNLKSAHLHVLADTGTSVLALVALTGGWLYEWLWLDAVMGIVGGVMVAIWARSLIQSTTRVLLDREMDHPLVKQIMKVIEEQPVDFGNRITDLHVWRVGKNAFSCAISLDTCNPTLTANQVKEWLAELHEIAHTTIEINHPPTTTARPGMMSIDHLILGQSTTQ